MLGGGIDVPHRVSRPRRRPLFGVQLEGPVAAIPWLLPTLIGVPASAVWTNYYKKRFNEGAQKTSESDEPLRRTA